jgi:hypothetical protein
LAFWKTTETSPSGQKTLDLRGQVVDAESDHYEFFIGNAIYAFGFGAPAAQRVCMVTQVD